MTEQALLYTLGSASVAAIAGPVFQLVLTLHRQMFPSVLLVKDEDGTLLGKISPEDVQTSSKNDLVQLHERIRRSKNVSLEAA